ncbi:MAG: STAS domain-containing protein [Ignavibacteriae bacterium]|nr:STAS domain-containing protein [Ignavibacteriota bacterium]
MKFRTEQHGDVTIISLDGNLMGGPDATTLNNKIHELIEAGKKQVVIDLAGVRFMNSSGLGVLIGTLSTLRSSGGNLKIANATPKITSLIEISKLSSVFQTYASTSDAVASYKK